MGNRRCVTRYTWQTRVDASLSGIIDVLFADQIDAIVVVWKEQNRNSCW